MKVKKFMSAIILSIVAFVTSFTVAFSAVQLRCVDCNKLLVRTHVVLGMLDYEHYFGCKEIEGLKTRRDLSYVGYRLLCVETDDGPLCYSCASNIINKKAVARDTAYTITVPESVVLNKTSSDYSGTYTGTVSVSANGFIQLDQRVYFSASNPEMYRTGSAAVTGTTTATTATDWESMDVSSGDAKTVYTVSADITPGSWNGTMMFFATVTEKFDILLGDNTTSLLAQNENAANVKFSSSAPKIATVDATGHVQTVSAGETTITKMVYDSTGKNLLYTAVYNITVSVETADMVTTRLAEPLEALTAAGTTIDTIQFGQYTIPSGVTTYDVSGNGSNTIKAFVDETALKVTNTKAAPVKFAAGNSVSFDQNSAFSDITTIKYDSVDTSKVTSANSAFMNMSDLSSITGLENWDTGKITDIRNIFRGCSALTSLDLSKWDTSNITDVGCAFYGCTALNNLNIGTWDTGKVTAIDCLLYNCSSLPLVDISNWNTGNVTNMNQVFSGCSGLTTLDIGGWNTSKVTSMRYLFSKCSELSQLTLTGWDTAAVTDMSNMFAGCEGLTSLNVKSFDTANVTNMRYMFSKCSSLSELNIRNFNTARVTSMRGMFECCEKLLALSIDCPYNFNTSNVVDMSSMFYYCKKLGSNAALCDGFDTSKVTNMSKMFAGYNGRTFGGTLCLQFNFNTSNVTDMSEMFADSNTISALDISSFSTAKVTNMNSMFANCNKLTSITVGSSFATANLPKSGKDTGLFYIDTKTNLEVKGEISNALKAYNFAGDNRIVKFVESTFATYRLAPIISSLSSAGTTIDSIYFGHYDIPSNTTTYDVSGVNDGSIVAFVSGTALKVTNTYNGPIKFIQDNGVCFYIASKPSAFKNITEVHYDYVDTSLVAYCDNAFYGMSKLTTITGLENWDTSNMTSMSYMFYYCPSITKLNVANFDTSKVTDMREMFESCNSLTSLDVSHFDTSKVTRMRYMFSGCQSLTSLDVSNFNTSNVIDMSYMFLDCHSLKELDLKAFDTKNVVSMYCMFGFSWSLEKVDISSFDTSNVMDMSYMFEACNSLKQIDVSNFDTCKVESMAGMFTDCYSLTSVDVSNFNTSKVTDFSRMFGHCFKLGRVVVGNSVLTKNLPVTGTDKGLFWVENNTHLTIVGNASSALRAYNYSGDNRTVSYVSSLRANSLNTKNILSEQTQYATPETAQRYDERPAA